jgi:hypothetical protein
MTDLRYAVRTSSRTPAFTAVTILTLALGIGATTIFSIVNAVLMEPLPYRDADRLVTMRGSLADLRDVEASSRSFAGMAMWASNLYNLRTDAEALLVRGGQISAMLLSLLGVRPQLGRNFTREDERVETVILGHRLWQSQFGGDPSVIGRRIDLGSTRYTIVGVAPARFRFPGADYQLWTPLGLIDRMPQQARNRAFRIFSAVARSRLEDGVSVTQARVEVRAIGVQLARGASAPCRPCASVRSRSGWRSGAWRHLSPRRPGAPRTPVAPAGMGRAVREATAAVHPALTAANVRPMIEVVAQ